MAYSFAAGSADRIDCGTGVAHATTWSIAVRLKVNAANTTLRRLCYYSQTSGSFLSNFYSHFLNVGTNELRIGGSGAGIEAAWVTGWTAGTLHTYVGTYDGSSIRIWADTDSTPKAVAGGGSGVSDQQADQVFCFGNLTGQSNGADCVIYEVAWWPGTVLGAGRVVQFGAGFDADLISPRPTHHWRLIANPNDHAGGQNGTVTGATLVSHDAPIRYPVSGRLRRFSTEPPTGSPSSDHIRADGRGAWRGAWRGQHRAMA